MNERALVMMPHIIRLSDLISVGVWTHLKRNQNCIHIEVGIFYILRYRYAFNTKIFDEWIKKFPSGAQSFCALEGN